MVIVPLIKQFVFEMSKGRLKFRENCGVLNSMG